MARNSDSEYGLSLLTLGRLCEPVVQRSSIVRVFKGLRIPFIRCLPGSSAVFFEAARGDLAATVSWSIIEQQRYGFCGSDVFCGS